MHYKTIFYKLSNYQKHYNTTEDSDKLQVRIERARNYLSKLTWLVLCSAILKTFSKCKDWLIDWFKGSSTQRGHFVPRAGERNWLVRITLAKEKQCNIPQLKCNKLHSKLSLVPNIWMNIYNSMQRLLAGIFYTISGKPLVLISIHYL